MRRAGVTLAFLGLLALSAGALAAEDCKAHDLGSGDLYDLTPLIHRTGNYQVQPIGSEFFYLLNVCHDLNPEVVLVNGTVKRFCPEGTEICQINIKDASQPVRDLGHFPDGPMVPTILAPGLLMFNYTGGDVCPGWLSRSLSKGYVPRHTVILFKCDRSAGLGIPKFQGDDEKCGYTFEWFTSAACAVADTTPTQPTPTTCEYIDTGRGLRYDLTALAKPRGGWMVYPGDGYKYAINVCEPVQGIAACGTSAGACQLKVTDVNFGKNLGLPASAPEIFKGDLMLRYQNGDACHDGVYQRSTTITFECDDDGGLGSPQFVMETDECEYHFVWETAAACPEKIDGSCTVSRGDKVYDLSGLATTSSSNWRVVYGMLDHDEINQEIAISPCGSLVSSDSPCRDGVSICQWDKTNPKQTRSLGNVPTLMPTANGVVATYSDGDGCTIEGARVVTMVNYICDPSAEKGTPLYVLRALLLTEVHRCEYLIEWRTAEACPKSANDDNSSSSSSNVGLIVFLVILSLILVYFVGGFCYNRFVLGAKGVDQIPHYHFCEACYYSCLSCLPNRDPYSGGGGAIQL